MQGKPNNRREFDIYESIIAKFLINLPQEEKKEQSRLSYHAEKAWYYYLDSVLELKDDSTITNDQKYTFFEKLRLYSPKSLNINPDLIVSKLSENKPTCGAIILNENQTKVLVIKNRNDQFGFPKGKWNQSEKTEDCAAREVYEEIGIYLHTRIDPAQKIEFLANGNVPSVFFVVKGVKESEKLTIDFKEISEVFWMNINDVSRFIKRFVSKSRTAWKLYLEGFSEPKPTIEEFIEHFQPKEVKQSVKLNKELKEAEKKPESEIEEENPFLAFKFDTEKLMKVFVL